MELGSAGVCGSLWARAILLISAAAGIAIGIEHHLGRQIWLWLRTGAIRTMARAISGRGNMPDQSGIFQFEFRGAGECVLPRRNENAGPNQAAPTESELGHGGSSPSDSRKKRQIH